jgi:putative endonuclease
MEHWYVYILQCADGSLYTGYTNNLEKRVNEHNSGKGAKSIRGKRPVKLVYCEEFENGTDARKREYTIKQWKKEHKMKLIFRAKSNPALSFRAASSMVEQLPLKQSVPSSNLGRLTLR